MQKKLVLASSSPFRKQLLERLHLDFETLSPDIDEDQIAGETASEYVCRLARSKAEIVARSRPDAVVIGSDQCALLDDTILGKPGTHAKALQQLRQAQGKRVVFHTGVCVLDRQSGFSAVDDVVYEVEFRRLSDAQLEHYLRTEQPYQCAGSFKAEGYGVCLFSNMRGDDPTAIVGLPLIRLIGMLESAGVRVV